MPELSIPIVGGQPLVFNLQTGEVLFVLGANGTGKSSLMQRLNRNHPNIARWISAHRQSWFVTDSISLSPHEKRSAEQNIRNQDLGAEARWRDHNAGARPNITIYELVESENAAAREIADAARKENQVRVKELITKEAPIEVINSLLRYSNLPIKLTIHQGEQVVASKAGGAFFSIARLSDGERNAVLIAASVLTAKPNTLILMDEPERHLHRSIISPLLTQIFKQRKDLSFIVSTHDVLLALDNPTARTLLIRGCTYKGEEPDAWMANLMTPENEIDDSLKVDIFGSRKKILFVEGTGRSLDQRLYSLVFPEVSVVAKSSCRDVEQAVTGIRGARGLHWLKAFGIIDGDARQPGEIAELTSRGIFAVPSYSVEALYYHPEIQLRVSARHTKTTGDDPKTLCDNAKRAAISALSQQADRLCKKVAEKELRASVLVRLPKKSSIEWNKTFSIELDVPSVIARERARFNELVNSSDLAGLIQRYPIRETPAPKQISDALTFKDREQYENAVLKMLVDDPTAIAFVQSLFGTLCQKLNDSATSPENDSTATEPTPG